MSASAALTRSTSASAVALLVGAVMLTMIAPLQAVVALFVSLILFFLALTVSLDVASFCAVAIVAGAAIPSSLGIGGLGSIGAVSTVAGLAAAALLLVTLAVPQRELSQRVQPVPLLVVAFLLSNLASFIAASIRPTDQLEASAADRGVIMLIAAGGIALLIATAVPSMERLLTVVKAVVVGGVVVAVVGVIQFSTGFDAASSIKLPGLAEVAHATSVSERSIFRRVAGTTAHPIEMAALLCVALPLGIHLAIYSSRRWWIAVGLMGLALPMSVSRTAVLAMVAMALAYVPAMPRHFRRRALLMFGGYVIAVRLLVPGLLGTIRALFVDAGSDPSINSRTSDYEFVNQFVAERPWFGRGYQTFIPDRYDFLDNQYLLSLVETGYVGLAALVALLAGSMVIARLVRSRTSDPAQRDLAQALLASIAAVAAASFAFDLLSFGTIRTMTFVVVGCIGALWRLTLAEADDRAFVNDAQASTVCQGRRRLEYERSLRMEFSQ